jgi:hypothetical protein
VDSFQVCIFPRYTGTINPKTKSHPRKYSQQLLVITEEDFDRQPIITAHLESIRQVIQFLHLLGCQLPAVKLEVRLNTLLVD